MKNPEQICNTVFRLRDEYIKERQKKRAVMIKAAALGVLLLLAAAAIAVLNVTGSEEIPKALPDDKESGLWPETAATVYYLSTDEDGAVNIKGETYIPKETSTAEYENTTAGGISPQTYRALTEAVPNILFTEETTNALTAGETNETYPDMLFTEATTNAATAAAVTEHLPETSSAKHWEDMSLTERYGELIFGSSVYSARGTELSADRTGEKLGDANASGFDIYNDSYEETEAEIFGIKGISDLFAVGARFERDGGVYVYMNRSYTPGTLGELSDGLGFDSELIIGSAYMNNGSEIKLSQEQQTFITELIKSCRDCPTEDTILTDRLFSVGISEPLLGANKSLMFYAEGYMTTNIMEYGFSYDIGEDRVKQLCEVLGVSYRKSNTLTETPVGEVYTMPAYDPTAREGGTVGTASEYGAVPFPVTSYVSDDGIAVFYTSSYDTYTEETTRAFTSEE